MARNLKRLWPNLLFLAALAGGCLWYLWDAASLSTKAANLVLILPAALIGVGLCVLVAFEDFAEARAAKPAADTPDSVPDSVEKPAPFDWRIPALMALVGGFIAVAMTLGFDIATFGFAAAALALLGERRPWVILGYPAVFALVVVGGLRATLSYEIPALLF